MPRRPKRILASTPRVNTEFPETSPGISGEGEEEYFEKSWEGTDVERYEQGPM